MGKDSAEACGVKDAWYHWGALMLAVGIRAVTGLPGFNVLLRVDESTYTPVRDYFKTRNGKPMGADHPIAWTHEPATGGRFFI